jgi:hypothetical protein
MPFLKIIVLRIWLFEPFFGKSQEVCYFLMMDIYRNNIKINIGDEDIWVNLKWFRGASRYNNGCTLYGKKYHLRWIMGRAKGFAAKTARHRIEGQ